MFDNVTTVDGFIKASLDIGQHMYVSMDDMAELVGVSADNFMNFVRASPRIAALETKKAIMRYSQSPVGGQRATIKKDK
eukprot:12964756-Alexandrium_andersonii.AAC.1